MEHTEPKVMEHTELKAVVVMEYKKLKVVVVMEYI
jgi:hypothetical protein